MFCENKLQEANFINYASYNCRYKHQRIFTMLEMVQILEYICQIDRQEPQLQRKTMHGFAPAGASIEHYYLSKQAVWKDTNNFPIKTLSQPNAATESEILIWRFCFWGPKVRFSFP